MSLVKWVDPTDVYENDGNYVFRTPVIPLSALTEVVEALKGLRDNILTIPFNGCDCKSCHYYNEIQRLLAQLEAVTT